MFKYNPGEKAIPDYEVGTGGMGKVYFGKWHGQPAAFKHIPLKTKSDFLLTESITSTAKTMEEFTTQETFKHKNILQVKF